MHRLPLENRTRAIKSEELRRESLHAHHGSQRAQGLGSTRQFSYPFSPKEADDFLDAPDVIRESRFHRWRHAERLMHAGEGVIHEV